MKQVLRAGASLRSHSLGRNESLCLQMVFPVVEVSGGSSLLGLPGWEATSVSQEFLARNLGPLGHFAESLWRGPDLLRQAGF